MPLEGSASQNSDKTMNYSVTGVKEIGDVSVSAGAFANNYRAETDKFNPNAPQYGAAGGSLGVSLAQQHVASITAQHIPNFGNQVTGAANVNVLSTDNHRVDVNAFTTRNLPKGPTPSYDTHGGGVDYYYKERLTAAASVAHTPALKNTNYSVSTGLNLHQTPTSSLNFGVGANRTDTKFGKGNWEPKAFLGYKRTF